MGALKKTSQLTNELPYDAAVHRRFLSSNLGKKASTNPWYIQIDISHLTGIIYRKKHMHTAVRKVLSG